LSRHCRSRNDYHWGSRTPRAGRAPLRSDRRAILGKRVQYLLDRLFKLVQVNVDRDPGKAGFDPDAVGAALPELLSLGALEPAGLMTIGRLGGEPEAARPTFRRLRELAERLRAGHPGLGSELSMGMTDDYPVAVEEGATIVRVGRALFGERPG